MRKSRRSGTKKLYDLVTVAKPYSHFAEAYRTLRTNIRFTNPDQHIKSILITSSSMDEGKSTITANLSVTLAQAGYSVALVDADMRKPTIHHFFGIANDVGLSHLLSNQKEVTEVLKASFVKNLDLILAGPIPPNPTELLGSQRMIFMLNILKENYDYILLDSPPVIPVADGQVLASLADGVLIVINAGKTKKDMVLKTMAKLKNVHARVIGTVVNKMNPKYDPYSYSYYSYGD